MRASALALLLASLVAAADVSDVVELKADTFNDFISSNDLVLAEFFAPWCGHCKALAPEYEEAATLLKEKNIPLAKIDCTEQADLCQEHGVEGYPTLKVFRGLKSVAPYSGARKSPAIVSYMTKQSLPAVSVLETAALEDFKTSDKVVVVGYFGADDKASNESFTALASELRDDYLFGAINDVAAAEAEGVKQPSVILYKTFDEGKDVFSEKFDKEALLHFTKTSATPLVGEVGPETYQGYMSSGLPLAYIFAETEEERNDYAKEFRVLAETYKGKINFATIDAKAFGQHAGNLNLEAGKWPAFAIQDTVKNEKYPFTKEFDVKAITTYVDDFVAGKVKPSIKSEPIPESQDGPVTIVVADNYKEIVLDDTKDVLIEFYAPWCGHCKTLAPKYDELGELFKPFGDKVVIAKVDATANDVPDEIQGFPTIKLYPAGNKAEAVLYSGARTVEDLAAFVKDSGKYAIDIYANATEGDKEETKEEKKPAAAAPVAAEDDTHDEL